MIHNILRWSVAAADTLLASTLIMLTGGQFDLGKELFNLPLAALLIGVIVSAYVFDTQ
ncbi:MAG: hypothetical protein LBN43_00740 [Oscillospiraceae bacterium]|jgi:hypothetical protein|nr:hypothetical protein [Oscillospiraceae bacterium]